MPPRAPSLRPAHPAPKPRVVGHGTHPCARAGSQAAPCILSGGADRRGAREPTPSEPPAHQITASFVPALPLSQGRGPGLQAGPQSRLTPGGGGGPVRSAPSALGGPPGSRLIAGRAALASSAPAGRLRLCQPSAVPSVPGSSRRRRRPQCLCQRREGHVSRPAPPGLGWDPPPAFLLSRLCGLGLQHGLGTVATVRLTGDTPAGGVGVPCGPAAGANA